MVRRGEAARRYGRLQPLSRKHAKGGAIKGTHTALALLPVWAACHIDAARRVFK
jgi:hypothetical protein